jgi:hypothetical protein
LKTTACSFRFDRIETECSVIAGLPALLYESGVAVGYDVDQDTRNGFTGFKVRHRPFDVAGNLQVFIFYARMQANDSR